MHATSYGESQDCLSPSLSLTHYHPRSWSITHLMQHISAWMCCCILVWHNNHTKQWQQLLGRQCYLQLPWHTVYMIPSICACIPPYPHVMTIFANTTHEATVGSILAVASTSIMSVASADKAWMNYKIVPHNLPVMVGSSLHPSHDINGTCIPGEICDICKRKVTASDQHDIVIC